jgi:hypothetical membrane protein
MNSSENRNRASRRFAGACGMLGASLTPVLILASTALAGSYDWSKNALSDLGESDVSLLFNGAVILGGLLNLCFAVGLGGDTGEGKLPRAGAYVFMASGICLSLLGVFTIRYNLIHPLVALGYMVLAPAGILIFALTSKTGSIRRAGLAGGTAALASIILLPFVAMGLGIRAGLGVFEFIEVLSISAWTFYMGARMYHREKPGELAKLS